MSCNPNLARLGTKEESKFQRQMEKKEKMTKAVATRDLEKWEPEVSMCEINKQSPTIGHESLQYTFVKVRAWLLCLYLYIYYIVDIHLRYTPTIYTFFQMRASPQNPPQSSLRSK